MPQSTVTLVLRPGGLPGSLAARLRAALPEVSAQVLADCNRYARDDTGRLIASSLTAGDPAQGRLVWRTPYARRVYYAGKPARAKNPGASLRWCDKAKAIHIRAWARLVAQKLGGG
jgi:hypothetical protein